MQRARLRVADSPAQSVQPLGLVLLPRPAEVFTGLDVAPEDPLPALVQPANDIPVELEEFPSSVPGAKVVAPASEQGIEVVDDAPDVLDPARPPVGPLLHLGPHPLHASLRGPPLEVVAANPLFLPQLPRHPPVPGTAKEIEAFLP